MNFFRWHIHYCMYLPYVPCQEQRQYLHWHLQYVNIRYNYMKGIEMLMILTDSHGGYAGHYGSREWIHDGTVMRILLL